MTIRSVLITSTVPDRVNSNAAIRHYMVQGFVEILGEEAVFHCPYEVAPHSVRRLEPDLVFAIGGFGIDVASLLDLRRAADAVGAQLAVWAHDDPYEFDYANKATAVADVIFTCDAWAMQHYDFDRVYHLPMAGCPKTHFREITDASRLRTSLFFCGVGYPNRVELLRQCKSVLTSHEAEIYGAHWPPDLSMACNTRLTPAEMADKAQRSLLTLNVGRTLNIANQRFNLPPSTPGPRTFEVAMSGSAQLYFVDGLEIMDYFTPQKEIILFDSADELRDVIVEALDNPDKYLKIARAAQTRALEDHAYRNRAASVVQKLSGS